MEPDLGTHAVVLGAKSETVLRALHEQLLEAGILCVLVEEPDPPWCGQATALGIAPQAREHLRPLLKKLQVVK